MNQIYLEPAALAEMLGRPDVRVVDTRASLADGPGGRDMWAAGHVPGAVHADWIEDWGTTVDGVEGMLPEPEEFAKAMSRLGVGNDTLVVAYDDNSLFTASRLAWALLHHGHQRVAILDGGFPAWQAAGLEVSTDQADSRPEPRDYRPGAPRGMRREMDEVRALLGRDDVTLVDCRMEETFAASEGRIPGANRLPSPSLIGEDGRFRRGEEVARLAADAGVDKDRPAVLYCGGGVSAAAVFIALRDAGFSDLALYDGSWSEWSQHADNPIQRHG
ncbi:sulfurtransferase [Nonomuraea harbinensis]|uniref:thiosulfate sulfurtransferase n=1 Tax=Nonomuraea harbinensis TaxID=1286938 RepID=A0ABW1CAG1_9ACTN|nr:sulfurtransferase [Nonomuraea harbinensis]